MSVQKIEASLHGPTGSAGLMVVFGCAGLAANIARQTAIKMRVDAIVVLIGFVFDRPIMPISLQLGNAALVLLCKFIGVPSLAGSFTIRQSKTILARAGFVDEKPG